MHKTRIKHIATDLKNIYTQQQELENISKRSKRFSEIRNSISQLRHKIPIAIIKHYDRLMERGKVPIAPAIRGVCDSCHIRLPKGDVPKSEDLNVCCNCGAFIYSEKTPSHQTTHVDPCLSFLFLPWLMSL